MAFKNCVSRIEVIYHDGAREGQDSFWAAARDGHKTRRQEMSKFMISFGANAMDHLPEEVMPEVAQAARAVVQEIINAGEFVVAGGLSNRISSIVATDGTVTEGPEPQAIGGVTVVDVPTREEAIEWAAKIAVACRCAQEVWEIGQDPELEAILRQADGRE
jgi:hypothetical protein